jgi:NAD(P)-dependent dehydrogenase (short-subunit alcohol dehydrogenase family)
MHTAFEGKVALVPGAARGIGLATAKAFAMAGASVVVADHNEKLLNEAAEKLRGEGHKLQLESSPTAGTLFRKLLVL